MSSPLILSFNLTDPARMDRVWGIITSRAVLAVNQRWAGDPGRRVTLDSTGWQAWAKPMGATSFAVLLMSTGTQPVHASVPFANLSAAFLPGAASCVRDLYTGKVLPPLPPGAPLEAELPVHDSGLYCAWPSSAQGACGPNDCPE